MRRFKNLFFSQLILAVVIFASCDDILEVEQSDILESGDTYQNRDEGRNAILGVYGSVQDLVETILVMSELRGDLVIPGPGAVPEFLELNESIFNAGNPFLTPAPFYKTINQANDVLANMDLLVERDPSIDSLREQQYIAELTYLRATAYLFLIKIYDQVVYFDQPITTYDPDREFQPISKVELVDILTQQIEDIYVRGIVTNEELQGATSAWFRFRFTNFPPFHLLGELYLEKAAITGDFADYENAAINFGNVIKLFLHEGADSGWWSMDDTFQDNEWIEMFSNDFNTRQSLETLLIVPFDKQNNQTNSLQLWTSNDVDGILSLQPSIVARTNFTTEGDIHRGRSIERFNGQSTITKYYQNRTVHGNEASFIIWRGGDSWMGFCEAVNRLGEPENALSMLNFGAVAPGSLAESYLTGGTRGLGSFDDGNGNTLSRVSGSFGVRGRVGLPPIEINSTQFNSTMEFQLAVDDIIMKERALEVAFEGSRFFDLIRSARWRNDPGYLARKVADKFEDPAKRETVISRLSDASSWYVPWSPSGDIISNE